MGDLTSHFYTTAGSWQHHTRNHKATMRGLKTVASTFVIVLILIAFYLLFVSSRLWVVNLGYRTSQALTEQRELFEENYKLGVEHATLIAPERIDSYARQRLGMREPKENQFRFVP